MRKFAVLLLILAVSVGLLPSALAQEEETFALTLMHTNDTHAAHAPNGDGNGGVAIQAAVVNQIRAEGGNSLLLDAGDRFTGTLFHTQFLGQDQVQVMNLLGYDAMTLGNHEFDNGDQVLADFIAGLEFPVVVANVDFSGSEVLAGAAVVPSTVIEVGGQSIGIIGMITADTVDTSSPSDTIVFDANYAEIANAQAAALAEQGVNKIILLTHVGIQVDESFITDLVGVDVVLGGHSHTLLSNQNAASFEYPLEFTGPADEPILYAQAGANNLYLGRLDVEFDAAGLVIGSNGDTIFLSRYISPDPTAQALVEELAGPVAELANQPTGGSADVELIGDRAFCRVEECALGNLIADGMRQETGAQIAFMNGGGIRANIDAGEIILGDILTVHPFGNQIATLELTGADIVAALENGVSGLTLGEDGLVSREGNPGRFLQVSGLRYTIDPTAEVGSRIVSVEVEQADGTFGPLDPAATYSVVTLNFLRQGGDGYEVFLNNAINPYDFGRIDYEVTGEYLASISPITEEMAALQGRISYVNAEVAPAP